VVFVGVPSRSEGVELEKKSIVLVWQQRTQLELGASVVCEGRK